MLKQGITKFLLELVSGRWQSEGLTEGQGAKSPSTMLRMVACCAGLPGAGHAHALPEASSGRII